MMSLVILLSATGCSTIADMLRPSATPAPLSTSTRRPTVAGAVASTSRPTPDITLTPSPTETATPLPTVTITPSPSPSPTIDALACLLAGEAEYGIVRWVSDGDTIVVEIDETLHSVRYLGIDAPAFIPSVEYMGPVAKERNIELVEGRVVRLFKDVTERDHFGQLLRYVEVEGGVFVNFQLALEGLARVQAFPPDVACTMELQQAEQIAREALLGVWKPTPTPPPTFTPVPSATRSASPTSTPTGTPTPTLSGSITPSLTPTPTTTSSTAQATLTQSPTLTPSQGVHISTIFYDGNVANNESDEYVEIKNFGTVTVNIGGWRLNAGDAGQDYIFPDHALVSGSTCRVYTSEYHAESCGFSFVSSQAIWNNDGDCGTLYDENDQLVDEYCYP